MTQAQIDRLMDMLDQDGDGEIDYKCARDVTSAHEYSQLTLKGLLRVVES